MAVCSMKCVWYHKNYSCTILVKPSNMRKIFGKQQKFKMFQKYGGCGVILLNVKL